MAPPPPASVPLFTPAPTVGLINSTKLQTALQAAVTAVTQAGKTPPFGLSIVDLDSATSDGKYVAAGYNQDKEHYAASMLKMACLYAAYGLLNLAQRFATARKPANAAALLKLLSAELDGPIAASCPRIKGVPEVTLPRWAEVLTASGSGPAISVGFTAAFKTALERMIVPSDNNAAGKCVRGVGYAYLNGLMLKHGFFDDATKTGVWLAGDFIGAPTVKIPCVNDTDTKQGTTSAAMARLGLVILKGKVFADASHNEMIALLEKSSHGSDSSYFTRIEVANHLSAGQVTHGKIGLGPLKAGRNVYSDWNVIDTPPGGGHYVACFTNVDYNPYAIDHVLWVFLKTVSAYRSSVAAAAAAPVGARAAPAAAVAP